MERLNWNEIYNRAINSPELKAKDEARYQVSCIMREQGVEPDDAECPEECIEDYMTNDIREYWFDESGNLIDESEVSSYTYQYGLTTEKYNQMMKSLGDTKQIEYVVKEWGVEACNKGYALFDYNNTGILDIEAINEVGAFEDDATAIKQAIADGETLISQDELPSQFKGIGFIDTVENRKALKNYCHR